MDDGAVHIHPLSCVETGKPKIDGGLGGSLTISERHRLNDLRHINWCHNQLPLSSKVLNSGTDVLLLNLGQV